MTNPGSNPESISTDRTENRRHRTPLWVKGFLVAAAVIVVTFAVIHLAGGGMVMNHTP